MKEPEEEGLGGDGGGGGVTWQQNTQIIKLSFEAYRHGKKSHARRAQPALSATAHNVGLSSPVWITTPKKWGWQELQARCYEKSGDLWGQLCLISVSSVQIYRRKAVTWLFELTMRPHDWMGMLIYGHLVLRVDTNCYWSHGSVCVCVKACVKGCFHTYFKGRKNAWS